MDDCLELPQSKDDDSFRFLAPELCENNEKNALSNKVDVYAFGIVLSYLITNKYADDDLKIISIKVISSLLKLEVSWVQDLVKRKFNNS